MGFTELFLKLPTTFAPEQIRKAISKKLRIQNFSYQIENKSLDARNKRNIHWQTKVGVYSDELNTEDKPIVESLVIKHQKRKEKVLIVGSGPAGFFCALVLQKAGYHTTLIERGSEVEKRDKSIHLFEKEGIFSPENNYAFGEGGAGTFSDGKLTSRTKHISKEKSFILDEYINAGAPEEIGYMAHPHLGTDTLKIIVKNLRSDYKNLGGEFLFENQLEDIKLKEGKFLEARTIKGDIAADACFIASGHSAYETYRMLMKRGVLFRTKNFAIGSRMEHPQELINRAQWGCAKLPGVKAAEYRLTSKADNRHPVYSFCMCPGGIVVPATAYTHTNIVNGMSYYQRNGEFANAACAVGLHPNELANKEVTALDALQLVEELEEKFFQYSKNYEAPACSIKDFISSSLTKNKIKSSYPMGVKPSPLWELLPFGISRSMKVGLQDFSRKLKGFEEGNLIGLESKTSAPIQVIREKNGLCTGTQNLYMVGEGSGYAGGIISSAADGIRAAIGFIDE